MRKATLSAALVVCVAALALARDPEVKPVAKWYGTISDEALEKAKPANGLIVDTQAWQKLWKTWCGNQAVPEIDYGKTFVFVETVSGPNRINPGVTLSKEGDLKVISMATLMAGDGFAYSIVQLDRAGVKTVFGKPLPAPATQPTTARTQ